MLKIVLKYKKAITILSIFIIYLPKWPNIKNGFKIFTDYSLLLKLESEAIWSD